MLNPNLDRATLAEQFAVDGRIRIENVLDAAVAERVRDGCAKHLHLSLAGWFRAKPL